MKQAHAFGPPPLHYFVLTVTAAVEHRGNLPFGGSSIPPAESKLTFESFVFGERGPICSVCLSQAPLMDMLLIMHGS